MSPCCPELLKGLVQSFDGLSSHVFALFLDTVTSICSHRIICVHWITVGLAQVMFESELGGTNGRYIPNLKLHVRPIS